MATLVTKSAFAAIGVTILGVVGYFIMASFLTPEVRVTRSGFTTDNDPPPYAALLTELILACIGGLLGWTYMDKPDSSSSPDNAEKPWKNVLIKVVTQLVTALATGGLGVASFGYIIQKILEELQGSKKEMVRSGVDTGGLTFYAIGGFIGLLVGIIFGLWLGDYLIRKFFKRKEE